MTSKIEVRDYPKYSFEQNTYLEKPEISMSFIEIPKEYGMRIVEELLKPFISFSKNIGLFVSVNTYDEEKDKIYNYEEDRLEAEFEDEEKRKEIKAFLWDEKESKEIKKVTLQNPDSIWYDDIYVLLYNSKTYIMTIYDDARDLGYSFYKTIWASTSLTCSIEELDKEGRVKKEITFLFDVETMKFLELYSVTKYSLVNHGNNEYEKLIKTLSDKDLRDIEVTFEEKSLR